MEAEKVIYSYIKSRGLKNTDMALRSELKNTYKYELSSSLFLEHCEDSFTSLIQGLSDPSITDSFYSSFEKYLIWASSSLELYKQDLLKFSGPLFIYMYLKLIEKGCINIAHSFFSSFSQILSSYDYGILSSIKTPNDLNSELVKKTYFMNVDNTQVKYLICIRRSALLLLMGFIEEQKLSCLFFILNQFIDIILTQESNKDVPVILHDAENYRNKTFLPLTVMQDEDKRREIKVPLPYISSAYISDKAGEQENMLNLANKKPFIICHNILCTDSYSCTALDVSEDGAIVCAGFEDSVLRVFNLQVSSSAYFNLVGHSGPILSLSISPDKFYITSSADDNEIRLWSLINNSCISIYTFHSSPIWVVKFSPTGHYFSSAASDGGLCLWSIEYTNPLKLFVGHILDVISINFHPRGTYLASGSKDKTVRVWDTSTGDCVRAFCLHSAPVSAVCFARNGKFIYSADEEGNLFAVDINEKEVVWKKSLNETVAAIAVSQDNFVISCVMENSSVVLIDSLGEMIKVCRVKKMNLFTGVFTVRNLFCVAGSFYEIKG